MLDQDTRTAILRLHKEGHGIKPIAKALGVSKNTVRRVLGEGTAKPFVRSREHELDEHVETIKGLYAVCKGNVVRVREELAAKGITPAYSTLTRYCRGLGLGVKKKERTGHYSFKPGEEMQHDTSPHRVKVGGKWRLLQCASLVFWFSTVIFAQVYLAFKRLDAKVFLTDAARFFGACCERCIVDNTSVIVAHGTGRNAVMVPEMEAFGARLGFSFQAHEVNDPDRKAHVERSFDYIENNFYPGRTFDSLADLNAQLVTWCRTSNAKHRRRLGASPIELFQGELMHLKPLPIHIPDVYDVHHRTVDLEGYVCVHTNRYSAPDKELGRKVEVHEHRDTIRLFHGHELLATHEKLEPGLGRRVTLPEHRYIPRKRTRGVPQEPPEAKVLRACHERLGAMVELLMKASRTQGPRAVKRFHRMYMDYPTEPFVEAVTMAVKYGLTDLHRLERMVLRSIGGDYFRLPQLGTAFDMEEDDHA